jgi:hypothetical protein
LESGDHGPLGESAYGEQLNRAEKKINAWAVASHRRLERTRGEHRRRSLRQSIGQNPLFQDSVALRGKLHGKNPTKEGRTSTLKRPSVADDCKNEEQPESFLVLC